MKSNVTTILAHLDLPKYDAVRDMIRASWKGRIEGAAKDWFERAGAFVIVQANVRDFPLQGEARFYLNEPESVTKAAYYQRHSAIKAAVIAGEYKIDYDKVQAAADRDWAAAKAFYAARVGEKIDALLEGEAKIECRLALNNFLVGHVVAQLGDKIVVLATSLKINYRYGVFAANRDMTVYRQVPTLVHSYTGFDLPAREAQIERETKAMKTARAAAIGEWLVEIRSLERQKRVWDDTYFSLNWGKKRREQSATLPIEPRDLRELNGKLVKISPTLKLNSYPTWEEAKCRVKVLREALKSAKLKLREVRQPKTEAVS